MAGRTSIAKLARSKVRSATHQVFSARTWSLLKFDALRLRARLLRRGQHDVLPKKSRLHFGCGSRRVPGWLNVDVAGSEYDVDLARGRLPWHDDVFDAILGQQVVEHLEIDLELLPLLRELRRVAKPGAELWLACPDMEKICRSYFEHRGVDLLEDRRTRWPDFTLQGMPQQQMINVYFHQRGQHKNLYDFELLKWALEQGGFVGVERKAEEDLLTRFPELPARYDDYSSLYVQAFARR